MQAWCLRKNYNRVVQHLLVNLFLCIGLMGQRTLRLATKKLGVAQLIWTTPKDL